MLLKTDPLGFGIFASRAPEPLGAALCIRVDGARSGRLLLRQGDTSRCFAVRQSLCRLPARELPDGRYTVTLCVDDPERVGCVVCEPLAVAAGQVSPDGGEAAVPLLALGGAVAALRARLDAAERQLTALTARMEGDSLFS